MSGFWLSWQEGLQFWNVLIGAQHVLNGMYMLKPLQVLVMHIFELPFIWSKVIDKVVAYA